MELYDHTITGIFPLSSLKEETSRGIGSTGTNNAARATLGLKALYADVGITAGLKRARAASRTPSPPVDGDGNDNGNASVTNGAVPGEVGGRREGKGSAVDHPIEKRGDDVCGGGGNQEGARLLTTPTTTPPSPAGLSLATMPLLGHRYRCVLTIGTGAFSDVFRAEDTFRPGRSVAIKVMKLGCGAIGIREVRYMRFLGSLPKSDSSPVVRLLDAFVFRGHQCLVMELLDDTLLPYTLRSAGCRGVEYGAASATMGFTGLDCIAGSRLLDQRMGADRRVFRRRAGGTEGGRAPSEPEQAWGRGVEAPPSLSPPLSCARGGSWAGSSEGGSGGSAGGCPTHVVRHVALQLLSAVHLLHSNGVIHADIKPLNILLGSEAEEGVGGRGGGGDPALRVDEFMRGRAGRGGGGRECSPSRVTVKLCDFGSAIHKSEACLYYGDFDIQTLAYRAPEVLMGCPFGPPIDTWSTGVILLELLLGRPLFHTAGSRAALLTQIVCAFGPLPLRRFRVGRFYSEYFAHDQSIKVGTSPTRPRDDDTQMGCCSCCWVEDTSPVSAAEPPRHGFSRCRGCCAETCRAPDQRKRSSGAGSTQANRGRRAPTFFAAAGRQSAAFSVSAGTRIGASLECPSWGVAHARLFRLVTAADGATPVDQGAPLASGAAFGPGPVLVPGVAHKKKRVGGGGSGGSGGSSVSGGGVIRPRACRFGSSDSSTARRNPRLLNLLAGLLSLDPDERLTPLQALAHPFFDEVVPFALPVATSEGSVKVKPEPTQTARALSESPCAVSTTGPAERMVSRRGCEKQGSSLGDTFWGTALESTPAHSQSMAAAATVTRTCDIAESSSGSVNGRVGAETRAHERGAAPTPGGYLNRGRNEQTRAALGVFTSRSRSVVQSRPETAYRSGKPIASRPPSACVSELIELDSTAQLRRLAETAEEMVGNGSRSNCGRGDDGSSTSSGDGRGNSSSGGSGSGSSSSSSSSGSGSGDGGGSGSGGSGLAGVALPPPPPTSRRKRFMNVLPRSTPELAEAQGEAKPTLNVSTLFKTSTEQQQQQQQPNLVSRSPPAAARAPGHAGGAAAYEGGAATIANRHRRNRFLTAATLAKLEHDKTKRSARAGAASAGEAAGTGVGALPVTAATVAAAAVSNCWTACTKPASMPSKKRPPKRQVLDASPGEDPPGTAIKRAKTVAAAAVVVVAPAATQELPPKKKPLFEPHLPAPGTEENTTPSTTREEATSRVCAAGDRGGRAILRWRAAGAGRTTPPRRAAMAAGVALSRLRREESNSDSDSFLSL